MKIGRTITAAARTVSDLLEQRQTNAIFAMSWREYLRLKRLPRLTHTSSKVLGNEIELTDPYWYLLVYREIFLDQNYRFNAEHKEPYIIDCGANIGMSLIYFNDLYPEAQIEAFEPDPGIFKVLERNVNRFGISHVKLHQRAVWNKVTQLSFQQDGSVGGKVVKDGMGDRLVQVKTVRLRDFLHVKVDFLKIDIEGAEYDVLMDCQDHLHNVENLFVEYHGRKSEAQKLDEILKILSGAGFRYHIKESLATRHPFLKEENKYQYFDLILNIFAYRHCCGSGE